MLTELLIRLGVSARPVNFSALKCSLANLALTQTAKTAQREETRAACVRTTSNLIPRHRGVLVRLSSDFTYQRVRLASSVCKDVSYARITRRVRSAKKEAFLDLRTASNVKDPKTTSVEINALAAHCTAPLATKQPESVSRATILFLFLQEASAPAPKELFWKKKSYHQRKRRAHSALIALPTAQLAPARKIACPARMDTNLRSMVWPAPRQTFILNLIRILIAKKSRQQVKVGKSEEQKTTN